MTLRLWIGHCIMASLPADERNDAYEGASAYLDWIDSLPVALGHARGPWGFEKGD